MRADRPDYAGRFGDLDDSFFAEQYGDDVTATDIANDPVAIQEIITALLADPNFFDKVVVHPNFRKQFLDYVVASFNSGGYFAQRVLEETNLPASIANNMTFIGTFANRLANDPFIWRAWQYQDETVAEIAKSMFTKSSLPASLIYNYAAINVEMQGVDGGTVAIADVRENPDGSIEYFFSPTVARNNPEAKIKVFIEAK